MTCHIRSVIYPDFKDNFVLVSCSTLIYRVYLKFKKVCVYKADLKVPNLAQVFLYILPSSINFCLLWINTSILLIFFPPAMDINFM